MQFSSLGRCETRGTMTSLSLATFCKPAISQLVVTCEEERTSGGSFRLNEQHYATQPFLIAHLSLLMFFSLVWWFCNSSKLLPLRHFLFVFACLFILNACLPLIFVFVFSFEDLFLLWVVLAICYVWIYISNAVTFSCQFWFQPTMLVQQWERSCVVTLRVCGVSSELWCPEECPNNVLIKAGKLTYLSTSLIGQCFVRYPVPSSAYSFTPGSVVLTWNFFYFCVWLHLACILKSKKNPKQTQNKATLP